MVPNTISTEILQLKTNQEIQTIIKDQNQCLVTFKSSQQKLEAFNKFSQARYQQVYKHFEIHTRLLKEVRSDLQNVFIKLRKIKNKLSTSYPTQMEKVLKKYPPPIIED